MWPNLLDLQCTLKAALCGQGGRVPASILGDDATERLAIYSGTIRSTLVKALRLSFPTVERLVGEEFFEGAAAMFAQAHVAGSAALDAYGSGFPAFLQDLPQCEGLAYLPDVARLDWAVARALHAPDAAALSPGVLATHAQRADALRFIAHPSITFLRSAFPVHDIWRAVLSQDEHALSAIDLTAGLVYLLVQRLQDGVEVVSMDAQEWSFAEALLGGMPLADAVAGAGVEIDVPAALARHMTQDRIVGIEPNPVPEKR